MESSEKPRWRQWGLLLLLAASFFLAILFGVMVQEEEEDRNTIPKVGYVIVGDVTRQGFNSVHYEGMKKACESLGLELLLKDKVEENTYKSREAVQELAAAGAKMIFLASYAYPMEVIDLIEEHPDISFASFSAEVHRPNLSAYFPRLYQARYLSGALAAMRSRSGILGYVAAMQNVEVCRGINAFTLGARRVNPKARVLVAWTGSWQDAEKAGKNAARLIGAGADVLTYHQNEADVADVAEARGVDFIGYNVPLEGYSDHNLTSVIARWDNFYTGMLYRFLRGELNHTKNYWVGIDKDAVGLSMYSKSVSPEMSIRLDSLIQELINNRLIFSGVVRDNSGQIRCGEGEAISDDALFERMNWLVEGVEVVGP